VNEIRVLPDDLVDQIAAGEVVERPASVVKELVENALDAGGTRLEVALDAGGISRIAVTDDGCGLAPAEAELAFRRHATSKIASAEDLATVGTLGFRGEALPSIAAVARVRMRTRRARDASGVELIGEGSGISKVRPVGCPEGTRVEVAELFARVPARRKFLKSPQAEGTHAVRWLERIALARPDVRFALERDARPSLSFPPTADPRERAIAVLPASVGERLVAVEAERGSARLRGFATPTDVSRGSSGDLHLFVNARPVRDRFLLHLVREAYRDALPPGRHPACVLYLLVDPAEVDVNVHPAKWEVRFRDPGAIRELVRGGLRAALGAEARVWGRARPLDVVPRVAEAPLPFAGRSAAPADFALLPAKDERAARAPRDRFRFSELRYLGQALAAYLVCEGPGGLILLDQHAAHERVLFERMRGAALAGRLPRQALLIPARVELPRSDADALLAHGELLERAGFELEEERGGLRGGVRFAVRALPAALAEAAIDWQRLLEETAAALRDPAARDSVDGLEGALHAAFATAACHSARRKGERLDRAEVEALLRALDETVWYPNCPHGRPIWLHLEEAELERRFLRR
jgi:DNA mismatch repair protein MutL